MKEICEKQHITVGEDIYVDFLYRFLVSYAPDAFFSFKF